MRKSNRAAAGAAAWQVVNDKARPDAPGVLERVGAIPRMLGARMRGRYTEIPASRVTLFILALLYIVSPIDAVPELFIPFLGLADDIGVAVWLTAGLMSETERFLKWERGTSYVQGHVVG
ncbi:YkvA family protein [Nocardiopsis sediminis]|uniref:YkvA family protein n=1 Tax=Nocardiopsis sediminis TaxID=1778267 RepID=A0ABV8FQH7_9ACTN